MTWTAPGTMASESNKPKDPGTTSWAEHGALSTSTETPAWESHMGVRGGHREDWEGQTTTWTAGTPNVEEHSWASAWAWNGGEDGAWQGGQEWQGGEEWQEEREWQQEETWDAAMWSEQGSGMNYGEQWTEGDGQDDAMEDVLVEEEEAVPWQPWHRKPRVVLPPPRIKAKAMPRPPEGPPPLHVIAQQLAEGVEVQEPQREETRPLTAFSIVHSLLTRGRKE